MQPSLTQATLRLFKVLPLAEETYTSTEYNEFLKKTIPLGFIVARDAFTPYIKLDGLTPAELNASFHKSWAKVRDTDAFQLRLEQVVHYITTYGYESIGLEADAYIPAETLEIPKLTKDLIIIKSITNEDLKIKLLKLLSTGIALAESTIGYVFEIAKCVGINGTDLTQIKNKEVACKLYQSLDMVPNDPVEYLRYAVYLTTGKTLLIKNEQLIEAIKWGTHDEAHKLFKKHPCLVSLASIFNRYKPLFLAFKQSELMSPIINRISKLSKRYHEPMEPNYVNGITDKIKNDIPVAFAELNRHLKDMNVFQKTKLAYALKYRTKPCDSIIYNVRNGASYATKFDFPITKQTSEILNVVLASITLDVRKSVLGKTIYLPEYIHYVLPKTEKQFCGGIPSGSYIKLDDDLIFGVHWDNVKCNRIDLDLSILYQGHKIGWDGSVRSKGILFSGDITTGGSELFYVPKTSQEVNYTINLNYYNYNPEVPVPFTLFVANRRVTSLNENHVVDPNDIITSIPFEISTKQVNLGMVSIASDGLRITFNDSTTGNAITSSDSVISDYINKAQTHTFNQTISLKSILTRAGATFTDIVDDADIDLSPDAISKTTIIDLLTC